MWDTLAGNSFQKIRTDYTILKRYDLSYQDFERLKLRIAYPPDSYMARIKNTAWLRSQKDFRGQEIPVTARKLFFCIRLTPQPSSPSYAT